MAFLRYLELLQHKMLPLSYLFVPAMRPERIVKAIASGAHAVIVDLEDAVDEADKQQARAFLQKFFDSAPVLLPPVWLRVNAASTFWFKDDLALVSRNRRQIAGAMLAKTESCADLDALQATLGSPLPVIALVESARGILSLSAISIHPQVTRLAFGSADLARDLGCEDNWDILLHARMQMLLYSASAGLAAPIDGVTFALEDAALVIAEAKRAARAGFGAKLCIHPSQLAPTHAGFAPTTEQVEWAGHILNAGGNGSGAQRLNGELVDKPVLERARQILQRHQGNVTNYL
jgi:citrate lyase subunit beta/citryl-CoA lyase